jgi:hypothetical protein
MKPLACFLLLKRKRHFCCLQKRADSERAGSPDEGQPLRLASAMFTVCVFL